ncbi:ATP-binding protein [Anaerostipes hadrus]|mgnify:FL=1|nr:ATP-binding protein [Anaerostipes hadrus]
MKYTKAGGTVGFRIIQKGHAPEGFADYDFVVKDNGIGMAITKNIVDMMGGTIKVKSELGVGSEFTISLRFKTTQQNSKRGVIKELNGFRALVADDSMDSCASVEKMLRTIGLRSEWTTSGKEAIFRAKYASQENDPFQVYIIDWLMPDMNGQISSRKQEKLELQHFVRNRCLYQNYTMYCRTQAVL